MFLDHIAQLGFLKHNSESSVFLGFPDSTRKVIAIKVCDDILKGEPGPEALSSSAHVRVLFECIGQAFGLNIDSQTAVIIGKAISVYENWFFTEAAQPLPIKEDEQVFFRDMFRHFSLLFLPRPSSPSASEGDAQHGKLCLRVLDIFSRIGSQLADRLTRDTWEVLLKIVLGISDSLLKLPEDPHHLADELTPKLLEVLVQLFLTSRTDNNRMWDHLTNLMRGWVHRQPTIIQWGATALALSKNVLHILYGSSSGLDYIHIALPHVNVGIRGLSKEYTLYVWYRALHFLRDLESIPIARNYITAMFEISKLVTCFLDSPISDAPLSSTLVQRRNTLLHIVGPWLFEAINNHQPGCDRGKAHAISALCDIFGSASQHATFDPQYLACFYRGLELALVSESNLLSSTVLLRAQNLFLRELKGCRVLVQPCLLAIRNVLTSNGLSGIDVPMTELRRAAISLLSSLLALPNHFSTVSLATLTNDGKPTAYYKSLVDHMAETIIRGLHLETDSLNQQLLLWTAFSFLLEHIDGSTGDFGTTLIQFLLLNLLTNEQWTTPVSIAALNSLSEMSLFSHYFEDKTDRFVVSQLCVYVERNMNRVASVSGKEPNEDLIVEPIYTMIRWILARQWIVTDSACLYQVLNVIELGLTGKYNPDLKDQVYFSPTEKIREAAASLFSNLFNHFGQFPTRSGDPSYNHSLNLESDYPDPWAVYIFDDTFLSVNHIPRKDSVRTNLIVRNPAGRFVWNCHLNYFIHQVINPPPLPSPVPTPLLQTPISGPTAFPVPPLSDPDFEQTLLRDMTPEQLAVHKEILKLASQTSQVDSTSLANSDSLPLRYAARPTNRPGSENDFIPERLLLSHLGLSWLDNRSRLCASTSEKIFSALDDQNSRLCLTTTVAYFPAGSDSQSFSLTSPGSEDYEHFISSIGWRVNIEQHRGFTGGLCSTSSENSPYYADLLSETMFHVLTLIQDPHKQKYLEQSKVVISWIEDIDAPLPSLLQSVPINILIYPLPSKLYRIKVIISDGTQQRGPLLDGMVISKHTLAHAVRHTAIAYARYYAGYYGDPISTRARMISDLITTSRSPVPLHKFLSAQFATDPS